jgi:hypothetical protein
MKTKLGISAGFFAAIAVLLAYFAGYTPFLLVLGYALLAEDNAWLKKSLIKVLIIDLAFSALYVVIGLLPNAISLIEDLLRIFSVHFYPSAFHSFFSFLNGCVGFLEKIVFVLIAVFLITEKEIKIPVLDNLLKKYVD